MKKKYHFYLPDHDTYFEKILTPEGFEIDKLKIALRYVKKHRIALDVGAHIGTWSLFMSQRFETVYSFEADPDNFACLEKNTAQSKNILPYHYSVSDIDKWVYLNYDKHRKGNTGSNYVTNEEIKDNQNISVRAIALDSLLKNNKSVDFVKIDVEGYEYFALLGMQELLKRNKPVIIMENKDFGNRYRNDITADELLQSLGAKCIDRIRNDFIYRFDE